jgi:hypothetical protein
MREPSNVTRTQSAERSQFAADLASQRNEFDNQFAGERSAFAAQRGNWKSREQQMPSPSFGGKNGRRASLPLNGARKGRDLGPRPWTHVSGAMQGRDMHFELVLGGSCALEERVLLQDS